MNKEIFDIEEEFDPSLLGFEVTLKTNTDKSNSNEKVEVEYNESLIFEKPQLGNGQNDPIVIPSRPARQFTALDLVRAITESYNTQSFTSTSSSPGLLDISSESVLSDSSDTDLDIDTNDQSGISITVSTDTEHEHDDENNDNGSQEDPIAKDFAKDGAVDPILEDGDPLVNPHEVSSTVNMEKTESDISNKHCIPNTLSTENDKPRSDIRFVRTRIPGSRRYRTGIRVYRASIDDDAEEMSTSGLADGSVMEITKEPEEPKRPDPITPTQKDISNMFGRDILDKIEHQSKLDNTIGSTFPSILRDLFPALSDLQMTIKIVNVFRRQLDLPVIPDISKMNKNDKINLRRSIAKMRSYLYIELISNLILPLAPKVKSSSTLLDIPTTDEEGGEGGGGGGGNFVTTSGETDTENENENHNEKEINKVTLTPTNLTIMENKLPKVFPNEKQLIKNFLSDDHYKFAYGEQLGNVIWQGGIGRMRGKGENGFRGKYDIEGSTHIFVDHSNILHGLIQYLYSNPSDGLPPKHLRTLSLPCLSLLLRRGRFTPPGSLHLVASSPLKQNFDLLVRLGWEISILKRVELYEDEIEDSYSLKTQHKIQNKISDHTELSQIRRFKEQGVDEILHLKILQILNEKSNLSSPQTKPSNNGNASKKDTNTLVLATGDARGGQFNKDGFPGAVREALKRGWNVELYSFTSGLSRAWKEIAKREKWYELGKFTIWALDDWAEQLVEVGEEDFL
ncbi:uncharacterized protein L201_004594 [Kwoniella dendrophila CBS 6074]|uniref:Uncharacterized protein n=1 Tax=Kwoniella dendrophila CBS 6074 TaxID=1295534 RepID=A0AAX4JWQ2_9TREE